MTAKKKTFDKTLGSISDAIQLMNWLRKHDFQERCFGCRQKYLLQPEYVRYETQQSSFPTIRMTCWKCGSLVFLDAEFIEKGINSESNPKKSEN